VQTTPALPWPVGQGGTLRLSQPITFDELAEGALVFTDDQDDTMDVRKYSIAQGVWAVDIGYENGGDFDVVYRVDEWNGESSTITVTSYTSYSGSRRLGNVQYA
jgi:hypothetical protein